MILVEFYESNNASALQDAQDDNSAPKFTEARKSRLLLREINKIRRMREVQSYERAKQLKKVRKQYQPPSSDSGMGTL
jgi:predicted dithiol-disulfide oxidoreductase (DUF899 family)